MRFLKLDHAAILAATLAFCATPVLAQNTTQQSQTTTTTTNSSTTNSSVPQDRVIGPESAHQLKKNERADKAQKKADKAERKLAKSDKMHDAQKKQAQADHAADHANDPY
jgi:hypothetical protein